MAKPRRLRPGVVWFVTTRCVRARFRLKPCQHRNQIIGFWIAEAQKRCPGVRVYAVVTNTNHLHFVLEDTCSELSSFMEHCLGQMARRINRLDGVRGPFFETEFSAIEVIDRDAIIDRIVYTVTNPVAANLVKTYEDWPGVVLWHGNCTEVEYSRFRKEAYVRAAEKANRQGKRIERKDFCERSTLKISRPEEIEDAEIAAAIADRERTLDEQRVGKVLGAKRVLALNPLGRPKDPKYSRAPLCHSTKPELKKAFVEAWRVFVRAYREASAAFRAGDLTAIFPDYTFKPSLPCAHPS